MNTSARTIHTLAVRGTAAQATLVLVLILSHSATLAAGMLEKTGDVLQFLLPAAALGTTYFYDDPDGRRQWLYAGATTLGSVVILKPLAEKVRPDGTAKKASFPSGHTASAFWGAALLDTRYDAWWGVPAYGLAALTGYSRIRADKHFADDVLAGASIALLSNAYWMRPIDGKTSFAPMNVPGGYGVMLQIKDMADAKFAGRAGSSLAPARFRFEFEIALADVIDNRVRAPARGGSQFDLANFENVSDTTATAIVKLDWNIAPRHSVQFMLAPFEARNGGTFAQPVNYAGTTFPANQQIHSSYTYYDLRSIYRYEFAPDSALIAMAGAGIALQRTSLRLSGPQQLASENVQNWTVLPILYGQLGARFARNWEFAVEASGMSISGDRLVDVSAALRYRFDRFWDVAAGYRDYSKQTDSQELGNSVSYRIPYLSIRHSF